MDKARDVSANSGSPFETGPHLTGKFAAVTDTLGAEATYGTMVHDGRADDVDYAAAAMTSFTRCPCPADPTNRVFVSTAKHGTSAAQSRKQSRCRC